MADLDPSIYRPEDKQMKVRKAECLVSDAYEKAVKELQELRGMTQELAGIARSEKASPNARNSISSILSRIHTSIHIMNIEDRRFHYECKRLRTESKVQRMRWWQKENQKWEELEKVKARRDGTNPISWRPEYERRIAQKYRLQREMEIARRRELRAAAGRRETGETSDCETTEDSDSDLEQ